MSDDAKEQKIPLVLIAVSLVLYTVAVFSIAGAKAVGPVMLAVIGMAVVQTVLLVAAAFLAAAVFGMAFGDLKSAILKFAAATLFSGAIALLIPLGGLVSSFVFLGLVMWLFDLEFVYAVVLSVLYWVVVIVVAILIGGFMR